jgi:hypothetical protein
MLFRKHNGDAEGVLWHGRLLQLQQGRDVLGDRESWEPGREHDHQGMLQLAHLLEPGRDPSLARREPSCRGGFFFVSTAFSFLHTLSLYNSTTQSSDESFNNQQYNQHIYSLSRYSNQALYPFITTNLKFSIQEWPEQSRRQSLDESEKSD